MHEDTFRQALKLGLEGVRFPEEGRRHVLERIKGEQPMKKKLSTGLILAFALLTLALTAFAVSQTGLLNYLVGGSEKASPELKDSLQVIDAAAEHDQIRLSITGAVYDGEKLALSWEAENLKPENPVMLSLASVTAAGEPVRPIFSSLDESWLPLLFGLQEEGFDRLKASGGMIGLMPSESMSGQMPVEVRLIIWRPAGPMVIVDEGLYPQENDDQDMRAYRVEKMALAEASGLEIAPQDQLDPGSWAKKGYVPLDADGSLLAGEAFTQDTGALSLRFTLDADRALAVVHSPAEDQQEITLEDCTVRINRLRLTPLTTRVDIDLIPHDGTAESALILQERYGSIIPTEKGEKLDFADMEFEDSRVRREISGGTWSYHVAALYPGLDSFPEEVTLSPRFSIFADARDEGINEEDMRLIEAFEKALTFRIK